MGFGNLGSSRERRPHKGWVSAPERHPQRGHHRCCWTAPAAPGLQRLWKELPRTAGGSTAACSSPESFPAHSQLDEGIRVSVGVHGRQVHAAHDAHDEPALLGTVHEGTPGSSHAPPRPRRDPPAGGRAWRSPAGKTRRRSGRDGVDIRECRMSVMEGRIMGFAQGIGGGTWMELGCSKDSPPLRTGPSRGMRRLFRCALSGTGKGQRDCRERPGEAPSHSKKPWECSPAPALDSGMSICSSNLHPSRFNRGRSNLSPPPR